MSPTCALSSRSVPAIGEGTSMVALSVMTSTSASLACTCVARLLVPADDLPLDHTLTDLWQA
jgi:hypothetical protein